MAIQVLAGIPWLAGVIGGAFSSIFGWFLQFFTKRLAIVGAAVTIIGTLTIALFAAIHALLAGVLVALPAEASAGISLFLPSNLSLCISAVVSARLLRYSYDWQIKIIQYKLF